MQSVYGIVRLGVFSSSSGGVCEDDEWRDLFVYFWYGIEELLSGGSGIGEVKHGWSRAQLRWCYLFAEIPTL